VKLLHIDARFYLGGMEDLFCLKNDKLAKAGSWLFKKMNYCSEFFSIIVPDLTFSHAYSLFGYT